MASARRLRRRLERDAQRAQDGRQHEVVRDQHRATRPGRPSSRRAAKVAQVASLTAPSSARLVDRRQGGALEGIPVHRDSGLPPNASISAARDPLRPAQLEVMGPFVLAVEAAGRAQDDQLAQPPGQAARRAALRRRRASAGTARAGGPGW